MRNWFVLKRFSENNFILDHTFFPILALKKTTDFPLKIDFPRINSTLPHPCSNILTVICASCFRLQQQSLCTLSSFCNRHDEQPFCLQLRHYELKSTSLKPKETYVKLREFSLDKTICFLYNRFEFATTVYHFSPRWQSQLWWWKSCMQSSLVLFFRVAVQKVWYCSWKTRFTTNLGDSWLSVARHTACVVLLTIVKNLFID